MDALIFIIALAVGLLVWFSEYFLASVTEMGVWTDLLCLTAILGGWFPAMFAFCGTASGIYWLIERISL